ncbi:hypothetical protein IMZ48_26890 [Candidatus Bathyarchaeota archaeon]|nr:hypothetical protein [Candidatus Bathyarchaeota archaeon]
MINFSPLLNDRIQIVSISPISGQEASKLHLEPTRDVDLEGATRLCDENCWHLAPGVCSCPTFRSHRFPPGSVGGP